MRAEKLPDGTIRIDLAKKEFHVIESAVRYVELLHTQGIMEGRFVRELARLHREMKEVM